MVDSDGIPREAKAITDDAIRYDVALLLAAARSSGHLTAGMADEARITNAKLRGAASRRRTAWLLDLCVQRGSLIHKNGGWSLSDSSQRSTPKKKAASTTRIIKAAKKNTTSGRRTRRSSEEIRELVFQAVSPTWRVSEHVAVNADVDVVTTRRHLAALESSGRVVREQLGRATRWKLPQRTEAAHAPEPVKATGCRVTPDLEDQLANLLVLAEQTAADLAHVRKLVESTQGGPRG